MSLEDGFACVEDPLVLNPGPSARGWHRLQLASECLQKYAWSYEDPNPPPEDRGSRPALAIGSLAHLALAQHYMRMKQEQEGKNPEEYMAPMEAVALVAEVRGVSKHVAAVTPTYDAYWRHYAADIRTRVILGVEELYDGMIGPYRLTGRIDLRWKDLGDRLHATDHKCLPASEELEGRLIEEIAEEGRCFSVCGWDEETGKLLPTTSLPFASVGEQDVYKVRLKSGAEMRFGYKHPVWVRRLKGKAPNVYSDPTWVRADCLQPVDEVAVAIGGAAVENVSFISRDDCWLVGALLSDGTLTSESFVLTKNDAAVRCAFLQAARRLGFGAYEAKPAGRSPQVRVKGRAKLIRWAKAVGMDIVRSPQRRVPKTMRSMGKEQTGILLGALWSGDGAIYSVSWEGKSIPRIVYGTRSGLLARDVQEALLRFGIPATISCSSVLYKGKRLPYWYTSVVTKKGKKSFLEAVIAGDIPVVRSAEEPKAVLTKVEATRGHGDGKIEENLWWVKVVSNRLSGREVCYDIEVPLTNTFLFHGVVTHNTTARLTTRHRSYYTMHGQFQAYAHLVRQKHGHLASFEINLIQHTNPKLLRHPLPRSPVLETQFVSRVIDIEKSIERVQQEDRPLEEWPKAMTELVCFHRYGACDHMDKCRFGRNAACAGSFTIDIPPGG